MEQLTSAARVRTALDHQEPDRVPLDFGGAEVAGINIHTMRRMREHLGLDGEVQLDSLVIQTGVMADDLIERLGVDVKIVSPEDPAHSGLEQDLGLVGDHFRYIDEFGIGWQMPKDGGHYYDLYLHPFADVETVREVEDYPWPDMLDSARFVGMKEHARSVARDEHKAVFLGRASSGMWEHVMWMTGYEKYYMDMVTNPKLCQAKMEKILELKMQYWGRVLELVEEDYVIVSCADDLGGQNGLLVSLDMYRELVWPYHKRLFQFLKSTPSKAKVYVFFHNDGAVYETLPLLIDAGVDIINPWQVNCAGMSDTAKFKREFGEDLTVWGGSCDTQRVLPFGTPQEVRDETRRRIEDLAPGGGFVFAPIHIIQDGVPVENIMAMWETLQEHGVY
jgi:uroporphyrinogen decarboxylase